MANEYSPNNPNTCPSENQPSPTQTINLGPTPQQPPQQAPQQTPRQTPQQPYQPGYQQPYQPGYQQPYQPGYQQPYHQPYQPGYQQPYQPGYQQPYQPGYQQPYQPGYQQPYQQGYQQPYQQGYQQPYMIEDEYVESTNPIGTTGFIIGIVALTTVWIPGINVLSLLASIAGGICSGIGLSRYPKAKARLGLIFSIIATVLCLFFINAYESL